MFNGEPSPFVTVMVPLTAGVPDAAGFDTAIALPQKPCPGDPSTNCGKYKTDCAEQREAASTTKTRLETMRFIGLPPCLRCGTIIERDPMGQENVPERDKGFVGPGLLSL